MENQVMDFNSWYPALLHCGRLVTALYKLKRENENDKELTKLIKLLLNSLYGSFLA